MPVANTLQKPSSPRSIETVISPSRRGLLLTENLVSRLISRGESNIRFTQRGMRRLVALADNALMTQRL